MSDVVICAEDLGKRYRIGEREPYLALRDVLARSLTAPFRWFQAPNTMASNPRTSGYIWALKDVSCEVKEGEVVGIIGRNGAGKSTLLKILARITEPTSGYATIRGRVASLLEVGTGFHPELTGRENIYLNGAILGMKKSEIERKFDEIVSFAEVEKFVDTPVKHYSSGMRVRLAFAVAAHLEPEILLVDEVLAVGDLAFQRKCVGRMGDVAQEGRTILFVSHNIATLLNLCKRAVMLEGGRIVYTDSVDRVVDFYVSQTKGESGPLGTWETRREGSGLVRFKEVQILNDEGESVLYPSRPVVFKMRFDTLEGLKSTDVNVGLGINTPYGERVVTLFTRFDRKYRDMDFVFENDTTLLCRLPKLPLRPGMYYVSLYADCKGELADNIKDAVGIQIQEDDFFGTGIVPSSSQGVYMLEQEWILS